MTNTNIVLPEASSDKWGNFTLFSSKEFTQKCAWLDKRLEGVETVIHQLLVTAVFYAQEHDDYDKAGRVMTSIRGSAVLRDVAIEGWFTMFSNIEIVEAAGLVTARKNRSKKANPCNWEEAYKHPFWTIAELRETIEKPDYTVADFGKEIFRVLNRGRKFLADGRVGEQKMNAEDVNRFKFLVEQLDDTLPGMLKKAQDIAAVHVKAEEASDEAAEAPGLDGGTPAGEARTGTDG